MRKTHLLIMAAPILAVLIIGVALLISESRSDARTVGATAEAVLLSPSSSDMGTVTITQGPKGILLAAEVRGLTLGGHAMSINAVGTCVPNFEAAGVISLPMVVRHGLLRGSGPHVDDLPNIYAGGDGTARADFFAVDSPSAPAWIIQSSTTALQSSFTKSPMIMSGRGSMGRESPAG